MSLRKRNSNSTYNSILYIQIESFLQTDNITRHSFFVSIYEERDEQYGPGKHVRELRKKVNENATVMKGALTKIIVVHFAKKKNSVQS